MKSVISSANGAHTGVLGEELPWGFWGAVLSQINNTGWAHLVRCVYDPVEQTRVVEDLVGVLLKSYDIAISVGSSDAREKLRSDIIGYFNTTFLRVAPVLKDRHFSEEKEWRIVTVPRKTTDPKFQAIVSSSRVSQYYIYEFTPNRTGAYDFLATVVVGPTSEPELIGGAMHIVCIRQNVRLNCVYYSLIPYRG